MLIERLKYRSHTMADEIRATSNDIILTENVDWVIKSMLHEGTVNTDENVIDLTSMGVKRFKRTSKSDREKWKREISDIVCSWLSREFISNF